MAALLAAGTAGAAVAPPAVSSFHHDVSPILEDYCYECHGDGMSRGKVAFDELSDADLTGRTDLWFNALQNLRSDIMPPLGKPRPTPAEEQTIVNWIKYSAFGIDPSDPDPGRVTIRRMNRIEYGRTVRALLGVPYPSEAEFPPDDTGHGFDNIADVLSISPLLLEKYLQAADTIISGTVPQTARVTPVMMATGRDFRSYATQPAVDEQEGDDRGRGDRASMGRPIKFAETAVAAHDFVVARSSTYSVEFKLAIHGPFNFDVQRCRVVASVDGQVRYDEALGWFDDKVIEFAHDELWDAGRHHVTISVAPLPDAAWPAGIAGKDPQEKESLELRILSVSVKGPFDAASRVLAPNYLKFFPRGEPPRIPFLREQYARDILRDFASRAFRRPVDQATLGRLVRLARGIDASPGGSFEVGISRAMMAVLASPRFIFRLEQTEPGDAGARYPRIDEYSLASRLSYFLWSSMPDARLFDLARKGQLRANLHGEVQRMLDDPQSIGLIRNFTGQWLQARDVEFIPINARAVLGLPPAKRGDPKVDFDGDTRKAMRSETEMVVSYIVKGDRSVLELVDSNYTFLNESLAKVYGIAGVSGKAMRYVALPEGSFRGGVLTEGSVLTVTSNPTRTSPVKRGQFILENILGTPSPPPPPNIPPLEDAKPPGQPDPTLREMLAVHRSNKLCQSCHARMDPLGLAFENFNALGNFRDKEAGRPIDATGTMVTGETFTDVRGLKYIITHGRHVDYYRCLTEKLMTYALGRGLEYYDVEAVDRIVIDMDHDGGRFSTLLLGVIDSAPFQRKRPLAPPSLMAQAGPVRAASVKPN